MKKKLTLTFDGGEAIHIESMVRRYGSSTEWVSAMIQRDEHLARLADEGATLTAKLTNGDEIVIDYKIPPIRVGVVAKLSHSANPMAFVGGAFFLLLLLAVYAAFMASS